MYKYLSFIFIGFITSIFAQNTRHPIEIVYKNCKSLSILRTFDTIAGVRAQVTTNMIDAGQYIQTLCSYGNPSNNRYDSVHVIAAVSYVKDSSGILKTAIYNDFLLKIEKAEKYAESNNYTASVVSERYFYNIDSLFFPGIRMLNSSEGNYVIWYIDGYVYKITLVEDNNIGNLNTLLRTNVRLTRNGKLLDADTKIMDIKEIKLLLQAWK